MNVYKSQALSNIDYTAPAIYHALAVFLQSTDQVQETLLSGLGLSAFETLSEYNLSPLRNRRDINMLGLINRNVLGKNPFRLSKLIHAAWDKSSVCGCAYQFDWHNHRLQDLNKDNAGNHRWGDFRTNSPV